MAAKPFTPTWLAASGVNDISRGCSGPGFYREISMKNPIWGYRLKNGEVEAKLFDEKLPRGWKDTPAGLGEK